MRKTFAIFVMLVCSIMAHAQTGARIFSYNAAGDVVPEQRFIESLDLTTEPAFHSIAQTEVFSSDKAYRYELQFSQLEGVDDPNIFEAIDIKCAGKNILSLHAWEAWRANFHTTKDELIPGYVTVRHLDVHVTALVFMGWCYDSTPPWITIVILNKDKATVVFNQRGVVTECRTDLPYGLNIRYVDKIQEYANEEDTTPSPADSELKKFRIWQEGQYLRFAQTQ